MAGIRGEDYIDKDGNRVLTGGLLAKAKNLAKNPNHYQVIGSRGGANGVGTEKGFAANRELAARVGKIGGLKSRRKSKAVK